MLFSLLVFVSTVLQIIHCKCPDGFDLVRNGECRGKYETISMRFMDAPDALVSSCQKVGANPVTIHNEEQASYWFAHMRPNYSAFFVLGLTCNLESKKWMWFDGSALDYETPTQEDRYTLNSDCKAGCTFYWNLDNFWFGSFNNENIQAIDIFCVKELKQLVPAIDSCLSFDDDSEDGVCYEVGPVAETWQEAQMNCRMLGANLASIHNLQGNSFIRRLAVSVGALNGVFLGATISGKANNYSWIDGTTWDYDNFAPGFPREGFGDCVAMDTGNGPTSAGQWTNIDCAEKLPVACIRDRVTITEPDAICNTDTWKEGQIITSPGFPFSASMPCDFYLKVDAGKRIEAEIILLEANSCCDNLIIYDGGYLSSPVMANLTGQVKNTTFTTTSSNLMRVTWEPNGGVNVLGLAMTFRAV